MSDRRWGKTHGVLRAHALLEGRSAVEEDDLAILKHVLWSSPDQQAEISKLCARLSNPINGKATELTDQAASVYDATMVAHGQSGDTQQKVVVVAEGIDKLKAINAGLVQLQEQAAAKGAHRQDREGHRLGSGDARKSRGAHPRRDVRSSMATTETIENNDIATDAIADGTQALQMTPTTFRSSIARSRLTNDWRRRSAARARTCTPRLL